MGQTSEKNSTAKPVLGRDNRLNPDDYNLRDELIVLNRCAKVVKGGRRFSFSALVCVGDGEGHVGLGFGKANEVPEAIAKAIEAGRKNLRAVPLMGRTLPHLITGRYDTARVLMKPASQGTGLIASAQVRKVLELAGVHDILAKSLGSDNVMNVAKATLQGLVSLKRPEQIARLRGKKVEELIGTRKKKIYEESMSRDSGQEPDKEEAVTAEVVETGIGVDPIPGKGLAGDAGTAPPKPAVTGGAIQPVTDDNVPGTTGPGKEDVPQKNAVEALAEESPKPPEDTLKDEPS